MLSLFFERAPHLLAATLTWATFSSSLLSRSRVKLSTFYGLWKLICIFYNALSALLNVCNNHFIVPLINHHQRGGHRARALVLQCCIQISQIKYIHRPCACSRETEERYNEVFMALERNLMTINFWLLLANDDDESDRWWWQNLATLPL